MLDRLSEWLANLSLLFFGALVLPFLFGEVESYSVTGVILGVGTTLFLLWLSLRLSRKAD